MASQKTTMSFKPFQVALALGTFSWLPNAIGNENYSLNLSLGEESNVPRGLDDFHTLGSLFSKVELSAGKLVQLGLNNSVLFSTSLGYSQFAELRGFDNAEIGVGAAFRRKFGFGANAPSLNISTSYSISRFEGAARDANSGVAELSLSRRFESGFSVNVGVDYQRNKTDLLPEDPLVTAFGYDPVIRAPFELFDFDSASVFIEGDYTFYSGWMMSAGFRRINGATVASTTAPSLATYKISDAFYSDPAFASESGGNPWFAYQLATNTDQFSTAISIPVLKDTSIDIGASWNDIRAPSGRDYDNTIIAVSLVHNF